MSTVHIARGVCLRRQSGSLWLASIVLVGAAWGMSPAPARGGTLPDNLDDPASPTQRYLRPDAVRAALHRRASAFEACVNTPESQTLFVPREEAVPAAELSLSFVVQRTGVVTDLAVDGVPQGPAVSELTACLAAVLASQPIRPHDGAPLWCRTPLVVLQTDGTLRWLPYPVVFTHAGPPRHPLVRLPLGLPEQARSLILRHLGLDSRPLQDQDSPSTDLPLPVEFNQAPPGGSP